MINQKVVVTDCPFPSKQPYIDVLSELGCEIVFSDPQDTEQFYQDCQDADGLIVSYADINKELISRLHKCSIVARAGIAVNNVDVLKCTERKIYVTNVTTPQVEDVANHAVALLLASIKKLPLLNETVKGGVWSLKIAEPIYKITGKVLGLAGFGNVSRTVAARMKPFGVELIAYDPYVPEAVFESEGVKKVVFEELVTRSDYISIHMPLVPETKELFNGEVFRKMKNTAYLINTARGGIIDEEALIGAIEKEEIAGAGLDVLASEFPDKNNPLYRFKNVILTPHSAYYSQESVIDMQKFAAMEVVRVLGGNLPVSLVNKELLKG